MKVTTMIGALGTITKGLVKELEDLEVGGRVETIQTTASLSSGDFSSGDLRRIVLSKSSERPSANADVKNSNEYIIINK